MRSDIGIVYTFYSYKGGVGRSMALSNVAALMAKAGHKVLVVDWDLEAPGLEKFFAKAQPDVIAQRAKTPGIVDLILAAEPIDWRKCVISVDVGSNGSRVHLITAGQSGADYTQRLHSIDFEAFFREKNLGRYIESLREQWLAEYDFVLIDSRTGVTDIGGICTVQLADVLVLLFTTTESSVEGIKQIVERAREQQQRLPVDRQTLIAVPVPARDESRTEYARSRDWKEKFAIAFSELYTDWLPNGVTARDAIDILRIPYVPYWSFGETLPVIEEGTKDPASIGHAYELLARLLQHKLDWTAAIGDENISPPSHRTRDGLSEDWFQAVRSTPNAKVFAKLARVEVIHGCLAHVDEMPKVELRGVVERLFPHLDLDLLERLRKLSPLHPIPNAEGILTQEEGERYKSFSVTRTNGDYFGVEVLREDMINNPFNRHLSVELTIQRAASGILRCGRLYRHFQAAPDAEVEIRVRWIGIEKRRLISNVSVPFWNDPRNIGETAIEKRMRFSLNYNSAQLFGHVKSMCAPLFELFNFAEVPDSVYQTVVAEILALDKTKQ
ncbi:MAG: ParA family protein [Acidobacteria bacterium]|nr:ParA family protein [Acidobacteriota bacterium]